MNNTHTHLTPPEEIDLFSLSPKNRRKAIEEYVSMCPFLGKHLSGSELIEIIQSKIEENKHNREKELANNLSKNEKTHIFLMRIGGLKISERIKTALEEANCVYLGDISSKSKRQLQKIRGIGPIGIQEIEKILATFQISLGLDKEFWNQIRPNNGDKNNSHKKINGTQIQTSDSVLSLLNGGRH